MISSFAALAGALIGAFSAQIAAKNTRASDRKKRCVDRVLAALAELDRAYASYATAATEKPDDPHVVLPLHGALRGYSQALQMLHIIWLRNHAVLYGEQLKEFYLMYGQPRDPLDLDRKVLTLQELNAEHFRFTEKLRNYEAK